MENSNLTFIGTGSATLGGTIKGCLLQIQSITISSIFEVMVYAVFSAIAGFATKLLIDKLIKEINSSKK